MKMNVLPPDVEATLRTTAIAIAALENGPEGQTLEQRKVRLTEVSNQLIIELVHTWHEQRKMIESRKVPQPK